MLRRTFSSFLPLFLAVASFVSPSHSQAAEQPFYIGTYTKPGSAQGIYRATLNTETGAISQPTLAVETASPSFLVQHPSKPFIYAVNEAGKGSVTAYAMEDSGKLRIINEQPSLGGGPTHIAIEPQGKNVLIANYGGGSIAVLPVAEDGSLKPSTGFIQHTGSGPDPSRQKEPHAHSIYVDKAGKHAYSCDLGLDKVLIYRLDVAEGKLEPTDPPFASTPAGAGPRHLAFSPEENFIYCVNEMGNSVTTFAKEPGRAILHPLDTTGTLPSDFTGKSSTAEIVMHPGGKFLFVSNRGHDSISTFAVGGDGKPKLLSHTPTAGKNPRFIGLNPAGDYLLAANQDGNNVVPFKVDVATGKLTPVGKPVECPSAVCILFTR